MGSPPPFTAILAAFLLGAARLSQRLILFSCLHQHQGVTSLVIAAFRTASHPEPGLPQANNANKVQRIKMCWRFVGKGVQRMLPQYMDRRGAGLCIGLLCLALPGWAQAPTPLSGEAQREAENFFESKVRPLLVAHCVECHGPEDQSGELRLDKQLHFRRGGGSGPLVDSENPQASLFLRAIGYQDNALQMPPDNKLPDEAIATLHQWVQRGAYWPNDSAESSGVSTPTGPADMPSHIEAQRETHWSYQPITRPEPPSIAAIRSLAEQNRVSIPEESLKTVTPIDQFVLMKLAEAGLAPNPRADRRTLIHRAYFTLLGLPPTHDAVCDFENDSEPGAFARLIDQLLSSPRYGERWARHWLDLARYGDTMGYLPGSMEERYPFAFTFRDYVIDAFNNDKPYDRFIIEQLAADQLDLQGDDRRALAAMGYLTVGRRFMNRQHDIIDDQIDVVTRGFLGLSVACARCHDHKYDPIPTADYYSLYGVFASSQQPGELPLLGEPQPSAEYDAFLEARAAKQRDVEKWLEERRVETEQELRNQVGDYLVYTVEQLPAYKRDDQKRNQGRRGPLRPAAVRNWQQFLVSPEKSPEPSWQLFRALALLPAEDFASRAPELIEQASSAEDLPQRIPVRLQTALVDGKPQSMPDAAAIFGEVLESVHQAWKDASEADAELQQLPDAQAERFRQLLWDAAAPTTLDRGAMVAHLDQAQRNKHNQLINVVNGVEVSHPGAPPRGMILVDKPNPVEPVIFRRGEPRNRGDRVPRRFLQILSHVDGGSPFANGSGRLELAQAITHPENPLTARVIVNRIWQHHFGEGLVRTPSDFGVRGQPPTHPLLLDYLASELLDSGWSIKHIQRIIMRSQTWQQSSATRPAAELADPENRLLWHMPRQRLEFEALRDRLLTAAGRLDGRIGGRSTMIHKDAPRRGLYAYIDREDFPGLLASFDVPSPDASRAQRAQTTVPQQALYLMNSEFVIEQAKAVVEASRQPNPNPAEHRDPKEVTDQQIRALFQRTLVRPPQPWELDVARNFVDPKNPREIESTLDPWVQLAQVLLLSNEFCFVD